VKSLETSPPSFTFFTFHFTFFILPRLTSIDTANALADSLLSDYSEINTELIDINNLVTQKCLQIPLAHFR
jgi:hypothetical protein